MRLALAIIITWVITFNTTLFLYGHRHIWSQERDGLNDLDKQMAKDKSDRYAVIAITKDSYYVTQGVGNDYKFIWAMVGKDGQAIRSNVPNPND